MHVHTLSVVMFLFSVSVLCCVRSTQLVFRNPMQLTQTFSSLGNLSCTKLLPNSTWISTNLFDMCATSQCFCCSKQSAADNQISFLKVQWKERATDRREKKTTNSLYTCIVDRRKDVIECNFFLYFILFIRTYSWKCYTSSTIP